MNHPWHTRLAMHTMPVLGGVVSAIVSVLIGPWEQNVINSRSLPDHEDMLAV